MGKHPRPFRVLKFNPSPKPATTLEAKLARLEATRPIAAEIVERIVDGLLQETQPR